MTETAARLPFFKRASFLGSLLLVAACLVLYEPGGFENTSGDNISIRYLGVSLLRHHSILLDPVKKDLEGVRYSAIYLPNGSWVPRTSFGLVPMIVPVFAAADWTGLFGDEWTHDRINRVARVAGVAWATAAVVSLYLFLLRIVRPEPAFLSAVMFATGTWNWSMGALGAGLQVGTVFLLTLNLHATWRLCTSRSRRDAEIAALLLGVLHAWVWSVRPQDVLLLVPIGLLILERRVLLPYAIPFVSGLSVMFVLQRMYYMNWMGMYGVINSDRMYRTNPLPGLAGILASPNYGAIVFFPLLFLVPWLWWRFMPSAPPVAMVRAAFSGRVDSALTPMQRFSLVLAAGCVMYMCSTVSLDFWHGGWAYGPRYFYDMQPYAWPSVAFGTAALLGMDRGGRRLRPIVAALFVWCAVQGTLVHGLGFRNFDIFIWNQAHFPLTDAGTWDTNDWIISDTWRAGSSTGRWPDALSRLKNEGF